MTDRKVPRVVGHKCVTCGRVLGMHGMHTNPISQKQCLPEVLTPLLRLDDVVKMLENNICFGDFSKCKCCQRTLGLATTLREECK